MTISQPTISPRYLVRSCGMTFISFFLISSKGAQCITQEFCVKSQHLIRLICKPFALFFFFFSICAAMRSYRCGCSSFRSVSTCVLGSSLWFTWLLTCYLSCLRSSGSKIIMDLEKSSLRHPYLSAGMDRRAGRHSRTRDEVLSKSIVQKGCYFTRNMFTGFPMDASQYKLMGKRRLGPEMSSTQSHLGNKGSNKKGCFSGFILP